MGFVFLQYCLGIAIRKLYILPLKQQSLLHRQHSLRQFSIFQILKKDIFDEKPSTKVKKKPEEHITLIRVDNSITVSTLNDAVKLSVRRGLKLIKINEGTSKKLPIYQLFTDSQYLKDDIDPKRKTQSGLKDSKVLSFSSRISSNDLYSKVNHIKKWLEKHAECRITITGTGNDISLSESVYKEIEKALGDSGRILQLRKKGSDLKFSILPPKGEK